MAVISGFAVVWNHSSHPFTLVASYIFIVLAVTGIDVWLYSNGFVRSDSVLRGWLPCTLLVGAGVVLLFGTFVWLSAAVRGMIDNGRKLPRIDSH